MLFGIFMQEVLLKEHNEIKTSMEFIESDEVVFPEITICSTTFYSKEKMDGKSLISFAAAQGI